MKVLSIGGGAREHAIVKALARSGGRVYALMSNRNPGIMNLAEDFKITKETMLEEVTAWAERIRPDIAVIGPEAPLHAGLVDALEAKDIPCVGPSKNAARIETSKAYMRSLMERHGIAGNLVYKVFESVEAVEEFMREFRGEVAVKPDGLTGGKGVKIMGEHLHNLEDVIEYARRIIQNQIGGTAKVVVEEKAVGEEFTLQAFCDGRHIVPMPAVQDHKRAYEGDQGPNTGGMGSYSQADGLLPFLREEEYEEALTIMRHVVEAMREEGNPYKGILYGQFMLTADGPKVIEFNARFGDPEAMNVLPLLKTNFLDICSGIVDGGLKSAEFERMATVCKYVVPKGYGVKPLSGEKVEVDEVAIRGRGAELFYASVDKREDAIYTTTSRSLAVVGFGSSIYEAEEIAESALQHVRGNVFMRHDIGKKEAIERKVQHMEKIRSGR